MPEDEVGTDVPDPLAGEVTGQESSLSNWAGEYVTDMLGKGQALADLPYYSYQGPLTAGTSDLQDQAFSGLAGLTLPEGYEQASVQAGDIYDEAMLGNNYTYDPITTDIWSSEAAEYYMSPYIEQALEPQLDEIARQNAIQLLEDMSRLTQAGAYGGSRQAIIESEANDNMLRLMAELTGQGYQDAYESAANMFTSDASRLLDTDKFNVQSQMFGDELGLKGLDTALSATDALSRYSDDELAALLDIYGGQLSGGGTQRDITSEGIGADYNQFVEERDYPYKQVQWLHSLLGGMPLSTQNYSYMQPSTWNQMLDGASFGGDLGDILTQIFGGSSSGSYGDIDWSNIDPAIDDVLGFGGSTS
jgi:hypothetical protein